MVWGQFDDLARVSSLLCLHKLAVRSETDVLCSYTAFGGPFQDCFDDDIENL